MASDEVVRVDINGILLPGLLLDGTPYVRLKDLQEQFPYKKSWSK